MQPPSPLELPPHTVFYRRIFPGAWFEPENRPFSNDFDPRDDESGLSVFLAAECSEADVLDDGLAGCGLVLFVYEDLAPCFTAFPSSPHQNPALIAAHIELRLTASPNARRIPKRKLKELSLRAGHGVIRKPEPKSNAL